jgi:hypothetical protein
MIRNRLGLVARTVVPAAVLLFLGASAGNASALSPAGALERAFTIADRAIVHPVQESDRQRPTDPYLKRDGSGYRGDGRRYRGDGRRHYRYGRRHRSNSGVFFGIYPFVPNYYGYGYSRPRYSGGSCGYWSRRCGANWGWNNSSYYGCLRYHGC